MEIQLKNQTLTTYQTLQQTPDDLESSTINTLNQLESNGEKSTNYLRLIWMGTFLLTFVVVGLLFFRLFAPSSFFVPLEGSSQNGSVNNSNTCTMEDAGILVGAGAVAGLTLVGGTFLAVGLSPFGPIAGGLFAANMGSGVVAGSAMATMQSAAMTSTAYAVGAGAGAVLGAAGACV